jgi:hypothetical protein
LPEEWQSLTFSKLRHRLFWLPDELTRPQNRPTLRLANSPIIEAETEKILRRIQRLKPLGIEDASSGIDRLLHKP